MRASRKSARLVQCARLVVAFSPLHFVEGLQHPSSGRAFAQAAGVSVAATLPGKDRRCIALNAS